MNQSHTEMTSVGRTLILATAVVGAMVGFWVVPLSVFSQVEARLCATLGSVLGAATGYLFFRNSGRR